MMIFKEWFEKNLVKLEEEFDFIEDNNEFADFVIEEWESYIEYVNDMEQNRKY